MPIPGEGDDPFPAKGGRGGVGNPGGTGGGFGSGLAGSSFGGGGFGGGGFGSPGAGSYGRRRRLGALGGEQAFTPMGESAMTYEMPTVEGAQPWQAAPAAPAAGGSRLAQIIAARGSGNRGIMRLPAGGVPAGPAANPMSPGGDVRDIANILRQLGIDAGYFSPEGSKSRIDALRGELRRKGQANRDRSSLMAKRYAPDDPRAQAFAQISSDVASGKSEQDALAGAFNEMQGGNEAFFRNLLMKQLAHAYGWDSADQAGQIAQWGQDQGGGLGGFFGDVLGAGLGSFAGGYGGTVGRRLGGG